MNTPSPDMDENSELRQVDQQAMLAETHVAYHRVYHGCDFESCDRRPPTEFGDLAEEAVRIVREAATDRTKALAAMPDAYLFLLDLINVMTHPAFPIFIHELERVRAIGDYDQRIGGVVLYSPDALRDWMRKSFDDHKEDDHGEITARAPRAIPAPERPLEGRSPARRRKPGASKPHLPIGLIGG